VARGNRPELKDDTPWAMITPHGFSVKHFIKSQLALKR
jgi:hypothetical protein